MGGDREVSPSPNSQAARPVDVRLNMPKPAKSSTPLPAVIVLAGDELFLQNQHLADIEQALFRGDDPGMGLVRLDPTAMGPDAMAHVLDEARTGSMFAPAKLVIVSPADPLLKKTDEDDEPPQKGKRPTLTNRE